MSSDKNLEGERNAGFTPGGGGYFFLGGGGAALKFSGLGPTTRGGGPFAQEGGKGMIQGMIQSLRVIFTN